MKIKVGSSEYVLIHIWLRKKFGKAYKCENKKCQHKSNNFDWSLKKGCRYERKRKNFKMLCKSCHHSYDTTDETLNKMRLSMLGKKTSLATKKKISIASKGKHKYKLMVKINQLSLDGKFIKQWDGICLATKALNFNGGGINSALSKKSKSKTYRGYKWEYAK